MAFERPCRSELAQFVSDHILSDIDRNVPLAVVHAECQPHHIGRNRRASRPGADHLWLLRMPLSIQGPFFTERGITHF